MLGLRCYAARSFLRLAVSPVAASELLSHRHRWNLASTRNASLKPAASTNSKNKPYYVTTPLFYVNAEPHIGHLHSMVLADVFTRFRALRNGTSAPRPILLTGTDEHGMKIQKAAQNKGLTPKALCDRVSTRFEALADAAGLKYDIFYRTSTENHAKAVQHIWNEFQRKGYIYKAHYEGWYSVSDETYYTPGQVRDQTSPDGTTSKVAIESGQPVEWQQEENYMFKLSTFQDRLLAWLESTPKAVQPTSRYKELVGYLRSGPLGDLSISRPRARLEWGVQVPDDPTHTIYVWIDALSNYLIATGYPETLEGSAWPADIHVVGKDILRFHAVYWPAMLMALDLPLPKTVLAHAHWTMDQLKMSKSRGNVVNPFEAIQRYTRDGIRCFLMYRGGLDYDSDFAERHVERDYQKYLAGQTGNLLSRMESPKLQKKLELALSVENPAKPQSATVELQATLAKLPGLVDDAMASFNPSRALEHIFEALGEVNGYITLQEPWRVEEAGKLAEVLPIIVEALRKTSILLQPFIPDSAGKLLDRLGVPPESRTWSNSNEDIARQSSKEFLAAVQKDGKREPLFAAMRAAEAISVAGGKPTSTGKAKTQATRKA